MSIKKKIDIKLEKFFRNNIKFKIYRKSLFKIIKFSKNNFNILTSNQLFFLFKKIDLNDLSKIKNIIKYFKIKITNYLPFDKIILENEEDKKKKKNNIKKKYKRINKYLYNISKILLSNIFLVNKIFRSNKKKLLKNLIYKIKFLKSNLSFDSFFTFKYKKFSKKKFFISKKRSKKSKSKYYKHLYSEYHFNLNRNFVLLNFLMDNAVKYRLKNNKNYKILFNFYKKKKFFFKVTLEMIDKLYHQLIKKFKIFDSLRNEIYDSINNLCNISFLKFNYYFLKNGSNLKWIFNVINNEEIKNLCKKEYFNYIKKKSKEIRKIEKKYFTEFKNLFKIFSFIELNKIKIDIIRSSIIRSKTKMVKNLTRKYYKNTLYDDIVQESNISLIKSINKYDLKSTLKFDSFITYNIKNIINRYVYSESRLIKLPLYILNIIKKVNNFIKNYNEIYGIDPEIDYISKKLDINKDKLEEIINLQKAPISIDRTYDKDKEDNCYEYVTSKNFDYDHEIFNEDLRNYLENLMLKLENNRSSNIINMRYGLNFSRRYTLEEVGGIYNISRERVRQIQNSILKKFKDDSSSKLKNYFNYRQKYYNLKK